jgi:ABC-type dipeptide/oligopeptide/nickel transport system permease component
MGLLSLLAALLWVIPTFLLAIVAQELQAFIYNTTNLAVSGGYARVNPLLIFWAAVILGIRPGAYVFRRARVVLGEGSRQDYVRTAIAKGLGWREVVLLHILRPSLPIVVTAWLISLRLMVGSLPLVEYFFGYPGLGQLFVTSFGIGGGSINADMAIACVVVLAGLFLVLEALGGILQQVADPRLREIRSRGELVA